MCSVFCCAPGLARTASVAPTASRAARPCVTCRAPWTSWGRPTSPRSCQSLRVEPLPTWSSSPTPAPRLSAPTKTVGVPYTQNHTHTHTQNRRHTQNRKHTHTPHGNKHVQHTSRGVARNLVPVERTFVLARDMLGTATFGPNIFIKSYEKIYTPRHENIGYISANSWFLFFHLHSSLLSLA